MSVEQSTLNTDVCIHMSISMKGVIQMQLVEDPHLTRTSTRKALVNGSGVYMSGAPHHGLQLYTYVA